MSVHNKNFKNLPYSDSWVKKISLLVAFKFTILIPALLIGLLAITSLHITKCKGDQYNREHVPQLHLTQQLSWYGAILLLFFVKGY